MARNLYKLTGGRFRIEWDGSEVEASTVEQACDALESLGVPDAELDAAITDMVVNKTTRANFGDSATFLFSDDAVK